LDKGDIYNRFSEPIPRKGTETSMAKPDPEGEGEAVFQNLFPARGRKLDFLEKRRSGLKKQNGQFFRTYSPQGDGNSHYARDRAKQFFASFSEPIPRKGTETASKQL